jgi:outer membrane receptor protein involved in Fe transport
VPVNSSNRRLIFSLSVFLIAGAIGWSQTDRGTITGTVTDSTGAIVPAVEVTATNLATNVPYSTLSTGTGTYRISLLPPGNYNVSSTKSGFKQTLIDNVRVAVGTTVAVDVVLQLGASRQVVNVEGGAAEQLQTTAEITTDVTPKEFETWPILLDGQQRQPTSFVFNSLPGTTGGTFQGAINGGQTFSFEAQVEGIPIERNYLAGGTADLTPSAESISEFSLVTGNIGATYAGAGSAVINLSVKSGGNAFHGSIFEINGNSFFESAGAEANAFGTGKGRFNQNNFGGSISGPIRRNKLFFFATYEGERESIFNPGNFTTVPTTAWRQGDFSGSLGAQEGTDALGRPVFSGEIFDPRTARTVNGQLVLDPFTYQGRLNVISPARFSTVSKNILPLIPQPEFPGAINNYVLLNGGHYGFDQGSAKIDYVLNEKHRLSGYYLEARHPNDIAYAGGFFKDLSNPLTREHTERDLPRLVRASEDWTINPTTLNHVGFGWNSIAVPQFSISLGGNWPTKIGLQGVDPDCFPSIDFNGTNGIPLQPFGDCSGGGPESGSWVIKDDFTKIHGKHTFQAGIEFHHYFYGAAPLSNQSGSFSFDQLSTELPGFSDTGDQFASFLLGAVYTASRTAAQLSPVFLNNYISPYFQDQIKLTPKLTITTGLRWEIPRPRYEEHNYTAGFDPRAPNPGADGYPGSLVFLADQHRHSFQKTYYKEFAPNLGVAYAVTPKTVVRGSYSMTYNPPIAWGYGYSEGFGLQSFVDLNRSQVTNGFAPVLYWDQGMPPPTSTQLPDKSPTQLNGSSISYTLPGSLAQAYLQHWNFGVQRDLGKETALEVDYVGVKGTRLPSGSPSGNCHLPCLFNMTPTKYLPLGDALLDDIGQHPEIPKPFPSFTGTVAQALRPYPQYTTIGLTGYNVGQSNYNALQVQIRKRPTKTGLGFIMAYTYSKMISDVGDAAGYNYNYQDFNNRKTEKSITAFSYPHDVKLTWVWEIPVGKNKHFLNRGGVLDAIVGGWTLTAIQHYRSGNPLQFVDSNLNAGAIFTDAFRPDRVVGVPTYQRSSGYDLANGTTWINPNAFTNPPASPGGVPFRIGNTPRVLDVYGPYQASETAGLQKTFRIFENLSFELRADVANLLNRTTRSDPVNDVADPNFGRILNVSGQRQFQFTGRIRF